MTNEYNPDGKEIRFIDSHYKDLFHIPDGSCVQIHYPDEMVVKPCTFIDEYHTQIGYNVFHICQFAEIMERNGASYMPEPEIMGDEAAWKVGKDRILAVQTCEDGYDYTLLDENYNEIDGGQVDNPELSMLEVRRDILESFGLERRELRAMFYEDVMEQAFEVGRQAVVVNDPIAELAFKLDRFAENFDPYEYMDQVDDVQAHIQEIKADLAAGNTAPYREFLNTAMRELHRRGKTPDPEHYEVTYYADLPAMWQDVPDNEVLEELFQMFNLSRPQDFEGHSLSVSDVIALKRNGEISVHYVDSIGFKELPGFLDKQPERPSVLMNLKEKCDAPECNPTVCRKVRAEHEL